MILSTEKIPVYVPKSEYPLIPAPPCTKTSLSLTDGIDLHLVSHLSVLVLCDACVDAPVRWKYFDQLQRLVVMQELVTMLTRSFGQRFTVFQPGDVDRSRTRHSTVKVDVVENNLHQEHFAVLSDQSWD